MSNAAARKHASHILSMLKEFFNQDMAKVREWFVIPNSCLEDRMPIEMLNKDNVALLVVLIYDMLEAKSNAY